jgi:hypothetical protein
VPRESSYREPWASAQLRALLGWRGTRAEAVALAEGALALPLVEAGFLPGAMMKDENIYCK